MSETDKPLSYEDDIKRLFRDRDAAAMRNEAGFDLHTYEDVKARAAKILGRLNDGSMPCDGPWPQRDIDKFSTWIDQGMNP